MVRRRSWRDLPSALEQLDALLDGSRIAVFCDYDGTLTEIVDHPAAAVLSAERRRTIAALARRCPVAIVSGRDLADVREMVAVEGVVYAGSHGLDMEGSPGAEGFLPALDDAQRQLAARLRGIDGVLVERKRFAVAVHYRLVADDDVPRVEQAVSDVAAAIPLLRRTGGKKVFELRPAMGWDKGRAVRRLLGIVDRDRALYLGDDETDEDAFAALAESGEGAGIVVGEPAAPTAAAARLHGPEEVYAFLERLATRL